MSDFVRFLRKRLKKPLPGHEAQKKMMPEPSDGGPTPGRKPPSDAVASGVMILLFPGQHHHLSTIFTLRSDHIEQGGEICFPGGRAESLESPPEAAFRETEEEIGISREAIEEVGSLTPLYVNTSNSLIHPSVGYIPRLPSLQKDPYEVQEIFHASLKTLNNPSNIKTETWELKGRSFSVPFWDIHEVPLWGATAMMLAEFMELYDQFVAGSRKLEGGSPFR